MTASERPSQEEVLRLKESLKSGLLRVMQTLYPFSIETFYMSNDRKMRILPVFGELIQRETGSRDWLALSDYATDRRDQALRLLYKDLTGEDVPQEEYDGKSVSCNELLPGYRFDIKTEEALWDKAKVTTTFTLTQDLTAD